MNDVLSFWFGSSIEARTWEAKRPMWFSGGLDLDNEIRQRFSTLVAQASAGELERWKQTPEGLLAWVLLLDQFNRNIHRGTGAAFADDSAVSAAVLEAIEASHDDALAPIQRSFLYMPLMHAEDLDTQERGVEQFTRLAALPGQDQAMFTGMLEYAKDHRDLIARFGRFAHRNTALGREATPDEAAYLAEGGARFGQ